MKENQRIRVTKKMLKETLIDLLQTKPITKISVSEICEKSELNRTTFYKYYSNEYSLLEEIENDTLQVIKEYMTTHNNGLYDFLTYLKENKELAKILFCSDIYQEFPRKVFTLLGLLDMTDVILKKNQAGRDNERTYYFVCYGGYAIIREWINNDFDCSPKELSKFFQNIVQKII